jgi:HAE1 family hydrophobic/amphiphilic exporter-1
VLIRVLAQKETSIDGLAQRAAEVEQMLRGVPGVDDVSNDFRLRPQIGAQPELVVARLFDIMPDQIKRSVNFAFEGIEIAEVDFGGDDEIDVRLRNLPAYRDELRDLMDLPLRSETGKIVTIEQVARVDRDFAPNVIRHYDGRRVINVRAQLDAGVTTDQVKARMLAALRPDLSEAEQRRMVHNDDVMLADADVIIEFGGENEIRDDAVADLQLAMIVAGVLMMVILVFKFNSFVQPVIVLFSVPLSLVGVALGLMICGMAFSVSAMIGVVALAGIVVNDAIVLVDFINNLKRAGLPIREAVIFAGQLRIRPIFLTTVTTIGGLLPLALNVSGGGEFWQPLTVSIIFGLLFATLLQLFIIPIACYSVERSPAGDRARRPQFAQPTPAPLTN